MSRGRSAGLLLALMAVACDMPTAPKPPGNAVRFAPPQVFKRWWAEVEACSGLTGDYSAITWYQSPDETIDSGYAGVYYAAFNRIALARGASSGELVRHEMLHALYRAGGHPRSLFVGRCQGVVSCIVECLAEEPAPLPDSAAVAIASSELAVDIAVSPAAPSLDFEDGNFQLLVSVHNPRATPVIVDPETTGGGFFADGFEYRSPDGTNNWESFAWYERAPEILRFAAGETRTYLFDFSIGAPDGSYGRLSKGTYTFHGTFRDAKSARGVVVTIAP